MAQVSSSSLQKASALSAITKAIGMLSFTLKATGVTFSAATDMGYSVAEGLKKNANGFHDSVSDVKNTLSKSLEDFSVAVRDGASFAIASYALEALLPEQKGVESLGANLIGKSDAIGAYSSNAALFLNATKAYLDTVQNRDSDSAKSSVLGLIAALEEDTKEATAEATEKEDTKEATKKSAQAALITAAVTSMKNAQNKFLTGVYEVVFLGLRTALSASDPDALSQQSATYKYIEDFCNNNEKCSEAISRYTEETQAKGKVVLASFVVVTYGMWLNLQSQKASYVKLNPNSDPLARNLGKIANSDVTFNCVTSQYTTGPNITFESVLEVAIKQFLKPNTTFGKLL